MPVITIKLTLAVHRRFFASQQLVRRLATQGGSYDRALRTLLQQAQATGSAGLLCNPFVQISTMLRLQLLDIPTAFADGYQWQRR